MQPITVWGHWGAPNPWKVRMVLEELAIPFDFKVLELSQAKEEAFTSLNPNGRLPAIEDPNTGVKLWESGAIILYLVDQYDKEGKISYQSVPEKYQLQQWLAFQISGQGPYFGQATWFTRFHPEKIQSAIDRYATEIVRVTGVLETALERNGTGWLVGDKCTYADLSFVTWSGIGEGVLKELNRYEGFEAKYPHYAGWLEKMRARPALTKAMDDIAKARKEHGLP